MTKKQRTRSLVFGVMSSTNVKLLVFGAIVITGTVVCMFITCTRMAVDTDALVVYGQTGLTGRPGDDGTDGAVVTKTVDFEMAGDVETASDALARKKVAAFGQVRLYKQGFADVAWGLLPSAGRSDNSIKEMTTADKAVYRVYATWGEDWVGDWNATGSEWDYPLEARLYLKITKGGVAEDLSVNTKYLIQVYDFNNRQIVLTRDHRRRMIRDGEIRRRVKNKDGDWVSDVVKGADGAGWYAYAVMYKTNKYLNEVYYETLGGDVLDYTDSDEDQDRLQESDPNNLIASRKNLAKDNVFLMIKALATKPNAME